MVSFVEVLQDDLLVIEDGRFALGSGANFKEGGLEGLLLLLTSVDIFGGEVTIGHGVFVVTVAIILVFGFDLLFPEGGGAPFLFGEFPARYVGDPDAVFDASEVGGKGRNDEGGPVGFAFGETDAGE